MGWESARCSPGTNVVTPVARGSVSVRLLVVATLLTSGCRDTPGSYLEGSLADTYALSFTETRVRLYTSELSIEYVDGSDPRQPVTIRVTLRRQGQTLASGAVYDLAERGAVTRSEVLGAELPDLESGELKLSTYDASERGDVAGTFRAVFVTSLDNRLELRGGFSAPLEVVGEPGEGD